PPGQVIADTDLNLVCTSGTSTVWADSVDCLHVEHTDVVAGEDSYLPSRFLDGQILTTAVSGSDSDFMITTDMQFAGSTRYLVLAPENAGDDPDVPSTWDTGITKRGRRLLKKRLAADYEINSITVNVGQLDTNDDSIVLETNPLVIRIYQEGFESSADSITITSPFTDVTQTVNVRILSRKEPSRTLIIDAYDTGDTPNNVTGITGHISVNALVLTDYIPEEAAPPIN
ncbi:hypothetical protein HN682_09465, partial [Candidatus Peregrinibacteria bacterium]|nr:hypothetical protein [Candidatus Peregrinibacteria bacterium]